MSTLLELLQAHAAGKTVQCLPSLGGPATCETEDDIARAWLDPGCGVGIKPTLTPVDLSVLIDSGIDCEFWDKGEERHEHKAVWLLGKPTGIAYSAVSGMNYDYCRPRLDHWHSWGVNRTLPSGLFVEVRRHATPGALTPVITGEDPCPSDVYAVRILKVADGYCWPWGADEPYPPCQTR